MTLLQQITFITTYTDLNIESGRVRIGVCPSVKTFDLIAYYYPNTEHDLKEALDECIYYLN